MTDLTWEETVLGFVLCKPSLFHSRPAQAVENQWCPLLRTHFIVCWMIFSFLFLIFSLFLLFFFKKKIKHAAVDWNLAWDPINILVFFFNLGDSYVRKFTSSWRLELLASFEPSCFHCTNEDKCCGENIFPTRASKNLFRQLWTETMFWKRKTTFKGSRMLEI